MAASSSAWADSSAAAEDACSALEAFCWMTWSMSVTDRLAWSMRADWSSAAAAICEITSPTLETPPTISWSAPATWRAAASPSLACRTD